MGLKISKMFDIAKDTKDISIEILFFFRKNKKFKFLNFMVSTTLNACKIC